MTAREHAIRVRTRVEMSRSMHILDRFSPTAQTFVCVKCGLEIAPALKPQVPECPDYARRRAAKDEGK